MRSSNLNAIGTPKKLVFKEKTTYRKEKGLPMYDETIFFFLRSMYDETFNWKANK